MERVRLSAEIAGKAESYLPLAVKSSLAQVLAPGCIEQTQAQPPRWQENIIGRKLAEVYVLAGYYLHLIDTSGLDKPEPEFIFTLEQYDSLSRLEGELANEWEIKGGEIIADFERFKDILDREIKNRLAEKNDPLNRLSQALAVGLTPEVMQAIQKAVGHEGNGPDSGEQSSPVRHAEGEV